MTDTNIYEGKTVFNSNTHCQNRIWTPSYHKFLSSKLCPVNCNPTSKPTRIENYL